MHVCALRAARGELHYRQLASQLELAHRENSFFKYDSLRVVMQILRDRSRYILLYVCRGVRVCCLRARARAGPPSGNKDIFRKRERAALLIFDRMEHWRALLKSFSRGEHFCGADFHIFACVCCVMKNLMYVFRWLRAVK